jgi:hypothetical protein
MDPVRNPYSPGAGTRPPALVGRDREIEAMDVALQRPLLGRDGRSEMLAGLRGVGKTVSQGPARQGSAIYRPLFTTRGGRRSSSTFFTAVVTSYTFDYHLGAQVPARSGVRLSQNWLIDLFEGQAAYFEWLEEHHHNFLAKIRKNLRRLERDTGQLEFRFDTASASDIETLVRFKSQQCRSLGWRDISAVPWVRKLVDHLLDTRAPWLTGTMSTLVADGSIISADFSLRSRGVWAGWFMAYDTSFEARSPGLVRMYMLIEALSGTGVRHIDLGKGVEDFKRHLSNGTIEVAEASITGSTPLGLLVGAISKMSYALRTEYLTLETKARQYVRRWRQHRTRVSNSS